MANNPFGGVPQQNMSAPTGQIQGGNFAAPQPYNAGAGSMQRNWGATSGPPQQDSMLAQGMNAWMMNPANRNNFYNYRAGRSGGRGFWGRGRKQQQQQQQQQGPQSPTTTYTFNLDQRATFGSQENLGRGDFGGGSAGVQFQQPTGQQPVGQNPAGQTPRQRPQLTQEQRDRRNATARARRALATDISKNGTPDQQQRIQTQGVAGGRVRQPRQPKTAAQSTPAMQPPAATNTNTSANVNNAPQIYAPKNGGASTGTSGSPGNPFISIGGMRGGNAQSGGASAQGADFDRINIY